MKLPLLLRLALWLTHVADRFQAWAFRRCIDRVPPVAIDHEAVWKGIERGIARERRGGSYSLRLSPLELHDERGDVIASGPALLGFARELCSLAERRPD